MSRAADIVIMNTSGRDVPFSSDQLKRQSSSSSNTGSVKSTKSSRSIGGLSVFMDPKTSATLARDEELTMSMYEVATVPDGGKKGEVKVITATRNTSSGSKDEPVYAKVKKKDKADPVYMNVGQIKRSTSQKGKSDDPGIHTKGIVGGQDNSRMSSSSGLSNGDAVHGTTEAYADVEEVMSGASHIELDRPGYNFDSSFLTGSSSTAGKYKGTDSSASKVISTEKSVTQISTSSNNEKKTEYKFTMDKTNSSHSPGGSADTSSNDRSKSAERGEKYQFKAASKSGNISYKPVIQSFDQRKSGKSFIYGEKSLSLPPEQVNRETSSHTDTRQTESIADSHSSISSLGISEKKAPVSVTKTSKTTVTSSSQDKPSTYSSVTSSFTSISSMGLRTSDSDASTLIPDNESRSEVTEKNTTTKTEQKSGDVIGSSESSGVVRKSSSKSSGKSGFLGFRSYYPGSTQSLSLSLATARTDVSESDAKQNEKKTDSTVTTETKTTVSTVTSDSVSAVSGSKKTGSTVVNKTDNNSGSNLYKDTHKSAFSLYTNTNTTPPVEDDTLTSGSTVKTDTHIISGSGVKDQMKGDEVSEYIVDNEYKVKKWEENVISTSTTESKSRYSTGVALSGDTVDAGAPSTTVYDDKNTENKYVAVQEETVESKHHNAEAALVSGESSRNVSDSTKTVTVTESGPVTDTRKTVTETVTVTKTSITPGSKKMTTDKLDISGSAAMRDKNFLSQMSAIIATPEIDSTTPSPYRNKFKKNDKGWSPVITKEIDVDTPKTAPATMVHSFTFPREGKGGDEKIVASTMPSTMAHVRKTVQPGKVGMLVNDLFKDLNLTGRSIDPATIERKKRTKSEGAAVHSPDKEGKSFKFLVEGIDYPAPEKEEGDDEIEEVSSPLSPPPPPPLPPGVIPPPPPLPPELRGPLVEADEENERTLSMKRGIKKRGFSYIDDKEEVSKLVQKAETVQARQHVEALEESVQEHRLTREIQAESELLVQARQKLTRQESIHRPATPPSEHSDSDKPVRTSIIVGRYSMEPDAGIPGVPVTRGNQASSSLHASVTRERSIKADSRLVTSAASADRPAAQSTPAMSSTVTNKFARGPPSPAPSDESVNTLSTSSTSGGEQEEEEDNFVIMTGPQSRAYSHIELAANTGRHDPVITGYDSRQHSSHHKYVTTSAPRPAAEPITSNSNQAVASIHTDTPYYESKQVKRGNNRSRDVYVYSSSLVSDNKSTSRHYPPVSSPTPILYNSNKDRNDRSWNTNDNRQKLSVFSSSPRNEARRARVTKPRYTGRKNIKPHDTKILTRDLGRSRESSRVHSRRRVGGGYSPRSEVLVGSDVSVSGRSSPYVEVSVTRTTTKDSVLDQVADLTDVTDAPSPHHLQPQHTVTEEGLPSVYVEVEEGDTSSEGESHNDHHGGWLDVKTTRDSAPYQHHFDDRDDTSVTSVSSAAASTIIHLKPLSISIDHVTQTGQNEMRTYPSSLPTSPYSTLSVAGSERVSRNPGSTAERQAITPHHPTVHSNMSTLESVRSHSTTTRSYQASSSRSHAQPHHLNNTLPTSPGPAYHHHNTLPTSPGSTYHHHNTLPTPTVSAKGSKFSYDVNIENIPSPRFLKVDESRSGTLPKFQTKQLTVHTGTNGQGNMDNQVDANANRLDAVDFEEMSRSHSGKYNIQQVTEQRLGRQHYSSSMNAHPDMQYKKKQKVYQVTSQSYNNSVSSPPLSPASPTAVDPELQDATGDGHQYHISLKLNASGSRPGSRMSQHAETHQQQSISREEYQAIRRQQQSISKEEYEIIKRQQQQQQLRNASSITRGQQQPADYTMSINQTMTMDCMPKENKQPVPPPGRHVTNINLKRSGRQTDTTQQHSAAGKQNLQKSTVYVKTEDALPRGSRRRVMESHHQVEETDDLAQYMSPAEEDWNDSDDSEQIPQVVRGSILIKNAIDTTGAAKVIDVVEGSDSDEEVMVEDNTNPFHGRYFQARENPMYNSDPDLSHLGKKERKMKPSFTKIFNGDDGHKQKKKRKKRSEEHVLNGLDNQEYREIRVTSGQWSNMYNTIR